MKRSIESLLLIILVFFGATASSCGQGKPKKIVQGSSVKELVPESPNSTEDGVTRILIDELYKSGPTEFRRVGSAGLKKIPPLPTGYTLFKDLVFQVKTEAVISGSQITVFNLPSAESESQFNSLSILHLEDDEMSPEGQSWNEVTVIPGEWNKHIHYVPKEQYEAFPPDFGSKRLASISDAFGIFVIALRAEVPPTGGFTKVEVLPSSVPETGRSGDQVTQTLVIKNKGPKMAAEVNVKDEIDNHLKYISASASQGTCKQSMRSSGRVLCYLGALSAGETAIITIVAQVGDNPLMQYGTKFASIIEVIFKERPTDFPENDNQVLMMVNVSIPKDEEVKSPTPMP